MSINIPTYEVVFNKDKSDVKSISLTSKPLFDNLFCYFPHTNINNNNQITN